MTPANADHLVDTAWLEGRLGDDDLRVFDCTVVLRPGDSGGFVAESARPAWERGHIPTSGFADLTGELSRSDTDLRFVVPEPADLAAAFGRLGIGDDSTVVLYDSAGSMWAARVWWMLRHVGFDRAAILNGGWKAWTVEGRAVSTEPAAHPPATLTPSPRPELIADKAEVLGAIGGDVRIIDALGATQYRGETDTYGRSGHIPGAENVPAMSVVDPDTGRFLPDDELAGRFGTSGESRTITYCGGGIAASLDAFVLHRLGHTDVAVYTNSLQEYASDPAAPLVTGEQP
ncbi:MAG: sulfurtransferase [Actinomycetota bacterium]|nr:sulfurtransferase [Actinomycetota bacterium]